MCADYGFGRSSFFLLSGFRYGTRRITRTRNGSKEIKGAYGGELQKELATMPTGDRHRDR